MKTLSPKAAYLGLVGQLHPLTEAQRQLLTKYRADVSGRAVPIIQQPNSPTPHPTPGMRALPGSWAAPRRPYSERGAAGTLRRGTRGSRFSGDPRAAPLPFGPRTYPSPAAGRRGSRRPAARAARATAGAWRATKGGGGRRLYGAAPRQGRHRPRPRPRSAGPPPPPKGQGIARREWEQDRPSLPKLFFYIDFEFATTST